MTCLSAVITFLVIRISLSIVNRNNFRHTKEFFKPAHCCSLKRQRKKKNLFPHLLFLLFLSPSVSFKSIYILFIHPHAVVVVGLVGGGAGEDEVIISLLSAVPPFRSPRRLHSPSSKCLFFLIKMWGTILGRRVVPPGDGKHPPPSNPLPRGAHSNKRWNQLHEIL